MRDELWGMVEAAVCVGLLVRDCSLLREFWQWVVPAVAALLKAEVFVGVEEALPFSSFDDSSWPAPFACL